MLSRICFFFFFKLETVFPQLLLQLPLLLHYYNRRRKVLRICPFSYMCPWWHYSIWKQFLTVRDRSTLHRVTGRFYEGGTKGFHLLFFFACDFSINIMVNTVTYLKAILTLLKKIRTWGASLALQWSKLRTSTAGGASLIPDWGTKIPHRAQCGQKTKTNK